MKITADTRSFAAAVDWATKSFNAKDEVAYVALTVTVEGEAQLTHANQTSFMKAGFQILDADIEEEINLALEGRYLQRLAGTLKTVSGPLELSRKSEDSETLRVKTVNGVFEAPLMDAVVPAEAPLTSLGEVSEHDFLDALQRLGKLCDPANAGFAPVLGTVDVSLKQEEERIVMMATDRYVLGEITLPFTPASTPEAAAYFADHEHLLLPVEDAVKISGTKEGADTITLVHEGKGDKFGYKFASGRVALFSLKEEDAMPYLSLKERFGKAVESSVTIEAAALKKALDGISNLAYDEVAIHLDITADSLTVGDAHRKNTLGVDAEEITVEDAHAVTFLRTIIGKAFAPIATKNMRIKWLDAGKPFIFEAILDDGTVADNVFVFAMPQIKQ